MHSVSGRCRFRKIIFHELLLTERFRRLGQECQPFSQTPPDVALFDTEKVVIVNNGRSVVEPHRLTLVGLTRRAGQMCELVLALLGESQTLETFVP